MPGQLDSIVALQKTLNELADAEARLHGVPEWMQELHEEHQARKVEIDAALEQAADASRQRREAEGVIADAQEKLNRYQGQISQVSTQREYGALLKEIDAAKTEITNAEQIALEALEQVETAEAESATLKDAFKDLDERYQAELARWEEEKPGVAARVDKLTARAEELRASIPRNIQTLFDRLLSRAGSQALARVERIAPRKKKSSNAFWHCTACNYNVRPQVVVEIRNQGALVQCDSCKRLLYFDDSLNANTA